MNRRNYLATIGATVTALSFAGCSEITSEITSEVDGDLVVDKTVIGSSQYTFEASEGDTINIWANNAEGRVAYISIVGTEDRLDSMQVETENSTSLTAESTGTHSAVVQQSGTFGEVEVQVGVE